MKGSASFSADAARNAATESAIVPVTTVTRWYRSLAEVIETKLPRLFLIYALPAVVVLSFIMPPFQVADELAHIERADQISRGALVSTRLGGTIDGNWEVIGTPYQNMWFHPRVKQTVAMARDAVRIHWWGPKDNVNFQGTAQYGPFCYLPQAIGVRLGRTAGIGLARTLIAARLLNGFAACVVSFLALSICRRGRAFMFATLLLPMTLSEFGSASQDGLLVSLSLLAAAMASRALTEKRPATTNEFALFAFIIVATTLARPSQFALVLLTPAFIRRGEPDWRTKVLIAVVALEAVICWMRILTELVPPLAPELRPWQQFHTLLAQPLLLPASMINYFRANELWFPMTVVGYLGWTDTPMPQWYYVTAAGVLLMALLAPRNRGRALWPGALALLTFAALLTLTSAALFISWTPVGEWTIAGMQGRYLLPVLPLLAWAVPENGPRLERALMGTWYPVLLFPLLTLPVMAVAIMERYYGSWSAMAGSLEVLLRL